jgi:hypothetical protein
VLAPITLIAALVSAVTAWRRRNRGRALPAHAVIVSPRRSTVIARDGGVRSAQSAKLTVDSADLERLGLIRVEYDADSRSIVLLVRPLTLLRFDKPEYTIEPEHGNVTWRIRGGLLVARSKRRSGWLSVDVRRLPQTAETPAGKRQVKIEVEVANFYPSIAAGFSTPVYEMTQSAIHVLVTHAYLRSLANLTLATSKVGSLSDQP